MQFKDGVDITGIQTEMMVALMVAERVYDEYGHELVVTSAVDGQHSYESLHYPGFAVDGRTRYFTEAQKEAVGEEIRDRLPNDFDVVVEEDHIHIEYQPKRK